MGVPAFEMFETRPRGAARTVDAGLQRLAQLYDEYAETSEHARLLARTPLAAAALVIACLLILAGGAGTPSPMLAIWVLLNLGGAAGLLALHRQAERGGCDLVALRAFAVDLNGMLLYAGFAWGSGAFLALPASSAPVVMGWFAAGGVLLIAAVLRMPVPIRAFLVPATTLPAAAVLLLGSTGLRSAASVLAFALALAGALAWAEMRIRRPRARIAPS
jgi:hypothetical protein